MPKIEGFSISSVEDDGFFKRKEHVSTKIILTTKGGNVEYIYPGKKLKDVMEFLQEKIRKIDPDSDWL